MKFKHKSDNFFNTNNLIKKYLSLSESLNFGLNTGLISKTSATKKPRSGYKTIRKFLVSLLLIPLSFTQAAEVTGIVSDYQGGWVSTIGAVSSTQPNDQHNLLAFQSEGSWFSTGVNDSIISGVSGGPTSFSAANFQALVPIGAVSARAGQGSLQDGDTATFNGVSDQLYPTPGGDILQYITDGTKGLSLITYGNNVGETYSFQINTINSTSIGDSTPDFIYVNASGGLISNTYRLFNGTTLIGSVTTEIPTLIRIATQRIDQFSTADGSASAVTGINAERPLRAYTIKLSEFGSVAAVSNATRLEVEMGSGADPAFFGLNTDSLVVRQPAWTVVKATTSTPEAAGDTLDYTFTIENTGNVIISSVNVTDAKCAATPSLSSGDTNNDTNLDVDETHVYSCTSIPVTQAEVDAGTVNNTVTVSGTPATETLADVSDTLNTTVSKPAYTMTKTSDTASISAPGTINYSFAFTNTGNTSLTNLNVSDANIDAGSLSGCPVATLAVGANATCSATRTISQAQIDAGAAITNTATSSATAADGTTAISEDDSADDNSTSTAVTTTPSWTVINTTSSTPAAAGDTLDYTFNVQNTGNVTISNVSVTDVKCATTPALTSGDTNNDTHLDVGETHVYSCTSIPVTQTETEAGTVDNTVIVSGTLESGVLSNVTDVLSTAIVAKNIITINDTPAPIDGLLGGTSSEIVFDNDTLNGTAIVPSEIILTPGTVAPAPAAGSISMSADGTITVAPGTTAGSYEIEYTICEKLNPTNCNTATVSIMVNAATIEMIDDHTPQIINGKEGSTTSKTVFDNHTLNGTAIVPSEIILTPGTVAPAPAAGSISMSADGTITVAPGTTAGSYEIEYTICEKLNPTNCNTARVTVRVTDDTTVLLTKTAHKKQLSIGDQVYYTIVVENTTQNELNIDIRDDLPTGFKFVAKTITLSRTGTDKKLGTKDDISSQLNANGNDPVRFSVINLQSLEKVQITYLVRVGIGAIQGNAVNTAQAFVTGSSIHTVSNIATASVTVTGNPVLDQSSLIGKVFHDRDADGYQDDHEAGIPGVRLATVEGLLIETDGHGRYHIPDVDGGRRGWGKNFILKVDPASLPEGARFTTENPRVLRITNHALNKINFGVKLPTQETLKAANEKDIKASALSVNVDLDSAFFNQGKESIANGYRGVIDEIAANIKQYGSGHIIVRSSADHQDTDLAKRRANTVRRALHRRIGNLMGHVKVESK